MRFCFFLLSFLWFSCVSAVANSYTEQLKKEILKNDVKEEREVSHKNYTQRIKKKLNQSDREEGIEKGSRSSKNYTDKLSKENAEKDAEEGITRDTGSFIERVNATLEPPDTGSAIQDVLNNQSELELKRPGRVTGAFGIKVAAVVDRTITGGARELRPFGEIYGGRNYDPEIAFVYELQPFYNEGFGNFGFYGSLNLGYFSGNGIFDVSLTNAATGESFGTTSKTNFQFFTAAASAGINFKLNALHYVRPFGSVGPAIQPFIETRDDGIGSRSGFSTHIVYSGGVAILLDWISRDAAWNQYDQNGVKHLYLTVEYTRTAPLTGDIKFNSSGVFSGISFEF